MGQKWSGTNTKSQLTAPPSSKATTSAKPVKSDREEKPKVQKSNDCSQGWDDTKSSSSVSTSLRTDDASKQKANNEPLYENLSYKG